MSSLGVYVHFPFCLRKCPYCDFVSYAAKREEIDHAGYADAVLAELDARASLFDGRQVETVFFGGGTPSLWRAAELGRVLAAILSRGARGRAGPDVEVTVECNPTSLDEAHARALADVGVSRLSIGVQGLEAERLAFLGRTHSPEKALDTLRAALRVPGLRVSGDLIYGVGKPVQSAEGAAREAAAVADTGVTHVSAYSLTIEPGTQFGELAKRGRLPLAQDDDVADSFFAIERELTARGFEHYEISNYARPGAEARHNLGYWRGRDYVGLGCGAFGAHGVGASGARRYRNETDPAKYMQRARARASTEVESEALDGPTRLRERIMLGLRLRSGFDLEEAAASVGAEAWTPARERAAAKLVAAGRLERSGGWLRVPKEAWFFTDGAAAELF